MALTGDREAPKVLVRQRLVFAAGSERGVYHQAAEAQADAAEALIAGVRTVVQANARAGVARVVDSLTRDGHKPRFAVVPTGGRRIPAQVAEIIRSHTMQHAAEGEFYRDVVAAACAELGLEVRRPVESEVAALACNHLGWDRAALNGRLKAMGSTLGPPWSEDQRLAVLAAWLQL
ncbi:MAG TPA: hypothetical protein VG227_01170 [Caulobacteraceae bacterium]|nr:hypothetical protein [Caulobacteraceae bacterium]